MVSVQEHLRALQCVGQVVGEVLKQLDERFVVKSANGPRYVVGVRQKLDTSTLKTGTNYSSFIHF